MLEEQKEQLSSFMDGNLCDETLIDTASSDQELMKSWYRYHIARDVMQNKLYDCTLTFDITEKVANAIAAEQLFEQASINNANAVVSRHLFWLKTKDVIAKLSQVGLAACVTLGIIAGVQFQQNSSTSNSTPILNTVPIGINVSPVGGISNEPQTYQLQKETIDQQQYNKIRLLIQDYELQKRLNVQQ